MPCSKNNNNTHHTRHTHTHTRRHTDCRLVGSHIWRALFSATFFMTLFLTLLARARLASSVLPFAAGEKEFCCYFPSPLSHSLSRALAQRVSLSLFQPVLSYVCFIIARKIRESRYNTNSNTNRNNESNKCSQTVDL